jgi:aspartate/methionine/tyrosine aminotransferase
MLTESDRMTRLRSLEVGGPEHHEVVVAQNQAIREAFNRGEKYWVMRGSDIPQGGMHNHALNEILIELVKTGYGSNYDSGTPYAAMFNEAVARFHKEFFDVDYDPKTDIIRTNAAGHAYEFFYWCFLKPGDVIISEDPSHALGYTKQGWETYGAETKIFPLIEEDRWEPDLDEMRKIPIKENKNNVITLVHPNNPLGIFHNEKTLKAIIDFAGENNLPIISDEMYTLVLLENIKCPSMAKLAGDVPVITLNSFAKFFMNPGWGIGYMAIHDPEEKIKEVLRVGAKSGRFRKGSTPITAAAAIGIMNCVNEHKTNVVLESLTEEGRKKSVLYNTRLLLKRCRENRDYMLKRIKEIDGLNCLGKSDAEFLIQLAREENIAFQHGLEFGERARGYFRTQNFWPEETYEEIFDGLEKFIKRHKK